VEEEESPRYVNVLDQEGGKRQRLAKKSRNVAPVLRFAFITNINM